jgi:hypothetical protein
MVKIGSIITISSCLEQVTTHETYLDLQHWEYNNCLTKEDRDRLFDRRVKLDKFTKDLEEKYLYPRHSLRGLELIIGNSTGLIEHLPNLELRNTLTNPMNTFIVKIRQNDPVIRTSIHMADKIDTWEHHNLDLDLVKWPETIKN